MSVREHLDVCGCVRVCEAVRMCVDVCEGV